MDLCVAQHAFSIQLGLATARSEPQESRFLRNLCRQSLLLFVTLTIAGFCFGQQQPKAQDLEIDPEHSTITVHVQRSGMFAFAGDNHEIRAPISKGKLNPAAGSIQFEIESAKMRVLDPKLEPSKRAQVQEKMLGPDVLDVAHFPVIQFTSTSAQADKTGHWTVTGKLSLHGQSHPVRAAVSEPADEIRSSGGPPKVRHYRGSATLKQTDFGIKPITIAGGTVKVKDEIKIDFEIVTR